MGYVVHYNLGVLQDQQPPALCDSTCNPPTGRRGAFLHSATILLPKWRFTQKLFQNWGSPSCNIGLYSSAIQFPSCYVSRCHGRGGNTNVCFWFRINVQAVLERSLFCYVSVTELFFGVQKMKLFGTMRSVSYCREPTDSVSSYPLCTCFIQFKSGINWRRRVGCPCSPYAGGLSSAQKVVPQL